MKYRVIIPITSRKLDAILLLNIEKFVELVVGGMPPELLQVGFTDTEARVQWFVLLIV